MKIQHIIFSFETGGAETMLVDIVNEQARLGHDVSLLIVNTGVCEDLIARISPEVRIERFNRTPGSMPLLLMARLNMFLLRRRPDIVHLHTHKLVPLVRVMRRRVLFTVHDLDNPRIFGGVRMAAISDAVKAHALRRQPGADVTVIENGIADQSIIPRPQRPLGTPVRIVQVGRLDTAHKGQDILIDAVAELNRRGIDATVTFMGGGPEADDLKARAAAAGISGKVTITGLCTRRDIYTHLCDYDIMCHPSRLEGFGLCVAEGMAAGLPLVVPDSGGPYEVADSGRLARTFPIGDPIACADALEQVIRNYPEALTLADTARRYVADNFSLRRMVARYIDLYTKMTTR